MDEKIQAYYQIYYGSSSGINWLPGRVFSGIEPGFSPWRQWLPWQPRTIKYDQVYTHKVCSVKLRDPFLYLCKQCLEIPRKYEKESYTMNSLTHWGRVTHIYIGKLTIIGSDNGLSPGRRQAIIWNNVGLLLIDPLETNFSEILIGIQTFSFKKMHLNMSSAKWRPFCLGLNVLKIQKAWGPLYRHGLSLIPAWISNYIHYKVWAALTYPSHPSMIQPSMFGNK